MLEGWDPLLIRAVKEFKTVLNWRVTEASVPTFFFLDIQRNPVEANISFHLK